MKSAIFDAAYTKLNAQQKKAVDSIDGPVIVLAGPGTGKTQVLATRIANILLKTDTPPYAILALTFTEASAVNMKARIVGLIGQPGHYVHVTTFHSFCSDVIKSYPEYFPIDPESSPLSDLESFEIMKHLIDTLPLDTLKPINSPNYYISSLRGMLSTLKREGILPADLQAHIAEYEQIDTAQVSPRELKEREKIIQKNKELLLVYFAYQSELIKRKRFDYDDMISLVVEAMRSNDELLITLQEKYHYFLVDEYQDTNSAQNAVVHLLANFWGDQANIFVVGDPHQSIFRFQGASVENVLQFTHQYPAATIITLTQGYRCPATLYDAAHALISHNESTTTTAIGNPELFSALNIKLESQKNESAPIRLLRPTSQQEEAVAIAKDIEQLLRSGVDPNEIAVLYRTNADGQDIEESFSKFGIGYYRDKGQSVFEIREIQQLLTFFSCIAAAADPLHTQDDDGRVFFELLLYPWIPVDDLLAYQLAHIAGRSTPKQDMRRAIQDGYDEYAKKTGETSLTAIEFFQAESLMKNLQDWATLSLNKTLPEWFELVIEQSGFLAWSMQQDNSIELLKGLQALFTYIKNRASEVHTVSVQMILSELSLMQEYGISLPIASTGSQEGVTLSTVHSAKGREWDYVYITRCIDKKWGNNQNRDLIKLIPGLLPSSETIPKERNEDERRLFYVGITRAKKSLTLSSPNGIQTSYSLRPASPTMFLSEIAEQVVEEEMHLGESSAQDLEKLLQPAQTRVVPRDIRNYLKSIVDTFTLTPTALNRYLQDPQLFLYENLLRIPHAKLEHFSYGTAIHSALEHMYGGHLRGTQKKAPIQEVITTFQHALEKEILTNSQYERRLALGKDVLKRYYEQYADTASIPLYLETVFGVGLHRASLDGIPLRGRIDRIDWIDKDQNTVRVIDYKTGRQRTENEIKGLTVGSKLSEREMALPESIRGGYKRQLLFYKLLTQLSPFFKYEVEEGVFDFVEPDKTSGKFVRRTLLLPQEDVEDLKKLIREVVVEIRTLKFLDDINI